MRLDYAERLEVEDALAVAFEPLRHARADLSPLRVRAAVRWGRGEAPVALRWTRALSRLSELTAAAGVAAIIFVAAVADPVTLPGTSYTGGHAMFDPGFRDPPAAVRIVDDPNWLRWLRLGRYVPLQDWLDPSVVRVQGTRPLQMPTQAPSAQGPF